MSTPCNVAFVVYYRIIVDSILNNLIVSVKYVVNTMSLVCVLIELEEGGSNIQYKIKLFWFWALFLCFIVIFLCHFAPRHCLTDVAACFIYRYLPPECFELSKTPLISSKVSNFCNCITSFAEQGEKELLGHNHSILDWNVCSRNCSLEEVVCQLKSNCFLYVAALY